MKKWFAELRRRKVFTTAVLYAGAAWVVLQVAATVFPTFGAPTWVLQVVTVALALGLPIAIVLAWAYDIGPGEIIRDPGSTAAQMDAAARPTTSGPSIAVLPFRSLGDASEDAVFAKAMSQDIVSGLTRHPTVTVLASGATDYLAAEGGDPHTEGRKLGVQYLLHGTVQRSDDRIRVTASLTDVATSVSIWSQRYDRALEAGNVFDIQDEIQEQIVATISDVHGVIYQAGMAHSSERPTDSLDAYECTIEGMRYDKTGSPEDHLRARKLFERAVELDPQYAFPLAHLSWIYTDEWLFGFNEQPDSMRRALDAAQRATRMAPADYHVRWLLSRVYYFMGERERFLEEAEESLKLNSSDGTTLGLIGLYTACCGEWDRGVALIRRAMQLNPNYPFYYHMGTSLAALAADRPGEALKEIRKVGNASWPPAICQWVAMSVENDHPQEAIEEIARLQTIQPNSSVEQFTESLARFLPFQPEMVARIGEGLVAAEKLQQAGQPAYSGSE